MRFRRALWIALAALVSVGAIAYLASRAGAVSPIAESSRGALEAIRSKPHVYFRSLRDHEFGQVVVAALDAPNEQRVVTALSCDRVDFWRDRGLCLVDSKSHLHPLVFAQIIDRDFLAISSLVLPGVTSRTRVSGDERYAVATVFVTGEQYDAEFTTRTTLVELSGGRVVADLEKFQVTKDGRPFRERDFNFWGVTFAAASEHFYATLATGGQTYLVEGDIGRREMRVLRENAECPSLSPDEQQVVIKSRIPGDRIAWRLHVIDLKTGDEWPIAGEARSIDDQAEWLDAGHVLYGALEERGLPGEAMNVWVASTARDAADAPRIFIRGADSPAVVRPASATASAGKP
ncbi:MAG: hypothetical protein ABI665_07020 [Vicinamibacterales bacterium]